MESPACFLQPKEAAHFTWGRGPGQRPVPQTQNQTQQVEFKLEEWTGYAETLAFM